MSTELDRNRVTELLPLYVIGALEADEMLAIEAYLQHHPDLLEQLATLEEVMVQVAQSTPLVPLPTDARNRLLARVRADLARATQAGQFSASAGAADLPRASYRHPLFRRRQPTVARPQPTGPVQPQLVPRAPWLARLGWIATISFLFAFALLTLNFLQQGRIQELSAEVARLTAEVTSLREVNQLIEQQLREQEHQLALFVDAERSVALAGTDLAPTAQGAFYLRGDEGVVVLRGLDPLPTDRTYQLWLVPPDGVPTSVGLLTVPVSELVSQTVTVPASLRNFAIVDVSIEQAGGSPAITKETIVLRGVIN